MIPQGHLEFLEQVPALRDWMNLNGYSAKHSTEDCPAGQLYTVWSDRTSASNHTKGSDAKNWLILAHCGECGAVDVYQRIESFGPGEAIASRSALQKLSSIKKTLV